MPYLTMVCVCPPQTSIRTHGLVTTCRSSLTNLPASASSRYSSIYFIALPHWMVEFSPLRTPEFQARITDPFPRGVCKFAQPLLHRLCREQTRHEPECNRLDWLRECIPDRLV